LSNFSQFRASVGNLSLPSNLTIQDDAEVSSGIEMSWKDESTTGVGNADDKLHLLVMSGDKVHILHANAARSDQSAEITLPVDPGATHIYA
ncbi:DUF6266 family protein, partial [Marinifilum flexuosum]|uniref:DUF6266 family protein n=1 Tax=Marinifilum flexuosum TaxID=1117708 RepID=UPI002495824B